MRGKDRKLRKCVLNGVFIQYHYICGSSGTEIRTGNGKYWRFKCLNFAVENYSNNQIQLQGYFKVFISYMHFLKYNKLHF